MGKGASCGPGASSLRSPEPVPVSAHAGDAPSRAADPATSITFLEAAAKYFENRDTGGEDRAHWSNVYNAQNCRLIADLIRFQHNALCSIVSWHADARDVFPDWKTTADALAEIADMALNGQEWLSDSGRPPQGGDSEAAPGEAGQSGLSESEGIAQTPPPTKGPTP